MTFPLLLHVHVCLFTHSPHPPIPERLQIEHKARERSESPGVPPVAESVEIVTGPLEQEHNMAMMRQMEATPPFKRAAMSSNWERQGAKNPRLTEGKSASLSLSLPSSLSPPPPSYSLLVITTTYMYM